MEAKIQRFIIKERMEIISIFHNQMACEHKWGKHEMVGTNGYRCPKCKFISLDDKLNQLIKKLLAKKK